MGLEQFHDRADQVEGADHQRLTRTFQPQGQHRDLDRDRRQGQEIIAMQRRAGGIEKMGREQQGQHQSAEQAGPALLEAEQQKLIGPGAWPRRDADRFQMGAYPRKAGRARGVVHVPMSSAPWLGRQSFRPRRKGFAARA